MKKKLLIALSLLVCFGSVAFGINTYSKKAKKAGVRDPHLTVIGPVKMADGLGRLTVELMQGLHDHLRINFIHSRDSKELDLRGVHGKIRNIIKHGSSTYSPVVFYQDLLWSPGFDSLKIFHKSLKENQIRIAYSMFESSKIPTEWVIILNMYFDAVAVPDEFLVHVYKNSGVNIPIFVLPLSLDLTMYLDQPLKNKRHHPMVFGNLGSCSDRKNLATLVRAFGKAFGNNPDVRLCINSRYSDKEARQELKQAIADLKLDNVFFSELRLESEAYLKLFQTFDCFVTLSKGEGFSIQPRESMALGIPVIATDTTAQQTICKSQLVLPVSCSTQVPAKYWDGEIYGHNFSCSVEEAANALRDMYENYDRYLENGQKAREWAKTYTHDQLWPLYLNMVKPVHIRLGNENKVTDDGIVTDSEQLYQKYQRLVIDQKK